MPARAARRRRGSLSAEEIAARGLELVDDEGPEALTMRALANRLGVGVMTLYVHFRSKEELVEQISELAISELVIPDDGAWHVRLTVLFENLRALLWRHPSVVYADTMQPLSGPAAMRAADAALAMLREAGLSKPDAVKGMSALVSYTFGAAIFRLNQRGRGGEEYARDIRGADPKALPHVSALAPQMLKRGSEAEFRFGLELIVDGLRRLAGDAIEP